jgi:hypothetical protein
MNPSEIPELEWLNTTELLEILRRPGYGGYRLRRSIPDERLIQLIRTGVIPSENELAETSKSREWLETWVQSNKTGIISQLPCRGTDQGKCTIYPCPEGRHLNCYLKAEAWRI